MKNRIPRIARRVRDLLRVDAGVSIIEVLAATLIFLILSIAVAQATVTSIRLAGDQKHRVTALSLAAGEIDYIRGLGDPFVVLTRTATRTIDDITFTIVRETSWVSSSGLDIPCGSGSSGSLKYKRINVRVNWTGQMAPTRAVSSDTILAPDGRINDPSRGTVMIAVTRADGSGADDVAVTLTPTSGGEALDAQPANTNTEGCTYALQVKPGTYSVKLTKSGYIGIDQVGSPTASITVAAGETANVPFNYDNASTFGLTYAGSLAGLKFASNYTTSYVNTYGTYYVDGTASSIKMFPWSSGYTPIAGKYIAPASDGTGGCRAVDPSEWTAGIVGAVSLGGGQAATPIATAPGGTTSANIRMGVVKITSIPRNQFVTAVPVNVSSVPGQPGCAVGTTLTFAQDSTSSSTNADRLIALPYGTWRLYRGTSSGSTTTALGASGIQPQTNTVPTGMVSGNTVVVDPRVVG